MAITIAAVALVSPGSAAAATEVPDASCPEPRDATGSMAEPDNDRYAQTFTALQSAPIVRAAVLVQKGAASTGDWVISINAGGGVGEPTDTVLASGSVLNAGVPDSFSTITADLAPAVALVPGQTYAIVISRPGGTTWGVGLRNTSVCPGGLFYSFSSAGAFVPQGPTNDMIFALTGRTVDPPPAAAPAATGQRAAALAKCKKKKGKRARKRCKKRAKKLPV